MQYQSFPGLQGDSRSQEKLKALRLPSLEGKRFLDVGCNEGFFCGYARFDGAAEVVGIDRSRAAISRAQARFPDCRFIAQSWEQLPEGKFDVVLLASALHYAEDQAALIHRLMNSLTDDGTLVLEIGIAPPADTEWVTVERSIDNRQFPTRRTLAKILGDYAWKVIGYSVQQSGDPIERYVVHVSRTRPYVYLLLETPGSGKSTLARNLFQKAKVPVVRGDHIYMEVCSGRMAAPEALTACIQQECSTTTIDEVTRRVFSEGLVDELVELWCNHGKGGSFALDSYVPEAWHQAVRDAFIDGGYLPVTMNWTMEKSMSGPAAAAEKAEGYLRQLSRQAAARPLEQLIVTRLTTSGGPNLLGGWHLDHPVNGQVIGDEESLTVSGWGLPLELAEGEIECYLRLQGGTERYPLDRRRPDVIKKRMPDRADVPERLHYCGFRFPLPLEKLGAGAEFGFVVNGTLIPTARIELSRPSRSGARSGNLLKRVGGVVRRLGASERG